MIRWPTGYESVLKGDDCVWRRCGGEKLKQKERNTTVPSHSRVKLGWAAQVLVRQKKTKQKKKRQ